MAVPEAPLAQSEHGLVPKGKGWFVVNAREAAWIDREGRGAVTRFEGFDGEADFSQLGINLRVLGPGEPMSMYHWEADLAVGARDRSTGPGWGGYPVDEVAQRHGAGVETETTDANEAYARFKDGEPTSYREGWLP